jgi:plastocyanin domain-containing protein
VIIEDTFKPAIVVAKAGKTLRLNFTRREGSPCEDFISIPAFGQRLRLTTNQMVSVEITPDEPGEYEFTSGSTIPKGKLIVEPS